MVEVADQVQSLFKRNGRFSRRLLLDAFRFVRDHSLQPSSKPFPPFRTEKLNESYRMLVDEVPIEIGRGIGYSRSGMPSGIGDVGSWSIAFWIYLLADHTGQMRVILLRGLDLEQSRQVPLVFPVLIKLQVGSNEAKNLITGGDDGF